MSDAEAGAAMGVSESSVERAKAVLREAHVNVVAMLERGEIGINTALKAARSEPDLDIQAAWSRRDVTEVAERRGTQDNRQQEMFSEPAKATDPAEVPDASDGQEALAGSTDGVLPTPNQPHAVPLPDEDCPLANRSGEASGGADSPQQADHAEIKPFASRACDQAVQLVEELAETGAPVAQTDKGPLSELSGGTTSDAQLGTECQRPHAHPTCLDFACDHSDVEAMMPAARLLRKDLSLTQAGEFFAKVPDLGCHSAH
jgi:hypothetical protein